MKTPLFIRTLLAALVACSFMPAPARADEGMWPFNNVPRALIKERYGFEITDDWLRKVQLASVRFNSGGSGAFVSADGLVLTNHHIASDTLTKLSTPAHDLLKELAGADLDKLTPVQAFDLLRQWRQKYGK